MAMQLNSVVFLSPYAEIQETASKRIHEAFDLLSKEIKYFNAEIIVYRSDGQIILGRSYPDADERVYEYTKLDFSSKTARDLYDLLAKQAVNGVVPEYDPQVHLDVIDRLNKRFQSGKGTGQFLAYAFIKYYTDHKPAGKEKLAEMKEVIEACKRYPTYPTIVVDSVSQASEGEA